MAERGSWSLLVAGSVCKCRDRLLLKIDGSKVWLRSGNLIGSSRKHWTRLQKLLDFTTRLDWHFRHRSYGVPAQYITAEVRLEDCFRGNWSIYVAKEIVSVWNRHEFSKSTNKGVWKGTFILHSKQGWDIGFFHWLLFKHWKDRVFISNRPKWSYFWEKSISSLETSESSGNKERIWSVPERVLHCLINKVK